MKYFQGTDKQWNTGKTIINTRRQYGATVTALRTGCGTKMDGKNPEENKEAISNVQRVAAKSGKLRLLLTCDNMCFQEEGKTKKTSKTG